jgi:hypothetical protein
MRPAREGLVERTRPRRVHGPLNPLHVGGEVQPDGAQADSFPDTKRYRATFSKS